MTLKESLTIFFASLLLLAGCSRPQDSQSFEAPRQEVLYSYAQTNDLRVAPQLVSGWYPVEEGAWRWMSKEAQVMLRTPEPPPAHFEVRLTLSKPHLATTGPVTLTILLNDKPFTEEKYAASGSYTLSKSIPPGLLTKEPTRVTLRVDKVVGPIQGGDQRELGAIILGAGFK